MTEEPQPDVDVWDDTENVGGDVQGRSNEPQDSWDGPRATADTLDDEGDQVRVLQEQAYALELPVWEPTGDLEVDAALESLGSLNDQGLAGHAPIFDEVYRRLHGRLSDLAIGTS